MQLAAVLLAAGGSTRLGSPKQLLVFRGRSLLRRAAEAARQAVDGPVAVVFGAGAGEMEAELTGLEVHPVVNPVWERGMGGSVRIGMTQLDRMASVGRQEQPAGVLLMLCDQPLVDEAVLMRLTAAFRQQASPEGIAAAAYHDTVGVPVLFGSAYFNELRYLPEAVGAKGLLHRWAARVTTVPMPEAAVDIDTRAQYERLTGEDDQSSFLPHDGRR